MHLFKSRIPKENAQSVKGKTSTILIPEDHAQEVTELESYTVKWEVKTGWSDNTKVSHKCIISEKDAKEFKKQLEESAKFIGAWIRTDMYRN